jgi:hypothetical protein
MELPIPTTRMLGLLTRGWGGVGWQQAAGRGARYHHQQQQLEAGSMHYGRVQGDDACQQGLFWMSWRGRLAECQCCTEQSQSVLQTRLTSSHAARRATTGQRLCISMEASIRASSSCSVIICLVHVRFAVVSRVLSCELISIQLSTCQEYTMKDDPVKDQLPDDPLALLNSAGLMQFLEGALQEVRFQVFRSCFNVT